MHGRELGFSGFGLWLWPLPPAETLEFAVEWPFGGIELPSAEAVTWFWYPEVDPGVVSLPRPG